MNRNLSSTFRSLAMAAGLQDGIPILTTNGKLIRQEAWRSGRHRKLRLVQRALKSGVDEGLTFINPRVGDNKRHSQFNQPFQINATVKGIAFLSGPDIEEPPWEKLAPQIHLVDESDEEPLLDRRFKAPTKRKPHIVHSLRSSPLDQVDMAIMKCLMAMCQKAGKPYCYPSRETIIKNLCEYSHVDISLRTLDYHLDDLEAAGYIRRQCRHQKQPDGEWIFHSNLYELCQRAWEWIKRELARLSKFTASFGLHNIANTSITLNRLMKRDGPSKVALSDHLKGKGAASPVSLSEKQLIEARILKLVAGDTTMASLQEQWRLEALLKS